MEYMGYRQTLREADEIIARYEENGMREPEEAVRVSPEVEEECPSCCCCGSAYDEDCGMGMIRYEGKYGVKTICADCFFDMIGWYDARMLPRSEESELDYDSAAYILRNMLAGKTGIPVVDEHFKELLAAVERVVDLQDRLSTAEAKLSEMKKGVA